MQTRSSDQEKSARQPDTRTSAAGARPVELDLAETGTYAPWFERQAARQPQAIAAASEAQEWTYAELNDRSDRLAAQLRSLGVGPDVLVAVCLERSLELLASLLAIWKAGGAYVPLDPQYPKERLAFMLGDSGARLLVTQRELGFDFAGNGVRLVCPKELPDLPGTNGSEQAASFTPSAAGNHLAYVMYTSGSTGTPKGVAITHESLLNHNVAVCNVFRLAPEDRVLQFAPISFDISVEEIFPTWLGGGAVVLRTVDSLSSMTGFLDFIARERITVLNLPTAYWHELVPWLAKKPLPPRIRLVVIGGEKASDEIYRVWKRDVPRSVRLINTYGPTETTVTATLYEPDGAEDTLPIGKPIANIQAVLLDDQQRPVPPGGTGELYLGGRCLARGYLHQPDLTAKRFIANPYPELARSDRLYRTGDLVRLRPDGNLEFIGRVDEQVKIRGYRIEPEEIGAALRSCPGIKDALVIARELTPSHKQLVAYYVPWPDSTADAGALREFLKNKLPPYMLPAAFVGVPAFPLTPAGKIDRRALPEPPGSGTAAESTAQPGSPVEDQLVRIWREVLQCDAVGAREDFFELGGDSLRAIQVISRVRETFGVELPLSRFFQSPTVDGLAAFLDQRPAAQTAAAPPRPPAPLPRNRPLPASFAQERLWVLHEFHPDSDAYNMPVAFRMTGPVDAAALENSLNLLIRRHEALRTTLHYADEVTQRIAPELRLKLEITDLTAAPAGVRERSLRQLLSAAARKPFDLRRGPLLRAALVRVDDKHSVFVLVMHHSISDGWSLGICFDELKQGYDALAAGAPAPDLPPLRLQYADYAHWQRETVRGESLARDLEYWKRELAGAPGQVSFPAGGPDGAGGNLARNCAIELPPKTVRAAVDLAQAERATPFMVLLAALAITLHRRTAQRDMVIGTVVAGRNCREFEKVLGCFMNFLPLRIRLDGAETGEAVLRDVRRAVLEGQDHQECPFEKIVAAVNPARSEERNPLYNVALLWQNYPGNGFAPAGLKTVPVPVHQEKALLDLRFEAQPQGDRWLICCEYNAGLFGAETMKALLKAYVAVFETLVREPSRPVASFAAGRRTTGSRLRRWLSFGMLDAGCCMLDAGTLAGCATYWGI